MHRLSCALLLAALALLAAVPSDAATHKNRCERHAKHAIARSGQALVFRKVVEEDLRYRLYACVRRSGAPRLLAEVEEDDDVYGSDAYFSTLRVGGRYAAGDLVTGTAAASQCSKYGGDPCPTVRHTIRILEIAGGRRVDVPSDYLLRPIQVSAQGVVAWLTGSSADVHLRATGTIAAPTGRGLTAAPYEVDHGAIDPASVVLHGRTLTWVKDGTTHTADVPVPTP